MGTFLEKEDTVNNWGEWDLADPFGFNKVLLHPIHLSFKYHIYTNSLHLPPSLWKEWSWHYMKRRDSLCTRKLEFHCVQIPLNAAYGGLNGWEEGKTLSSGSRDAEGKVRKRRMCTEEESGARGERIGMEFGHIKPRWSVYVYQYVHADEWMYL